MAPTFNKLYEAAFNRGLHLKRLNGSFSEVRLKCSRTTIGAANTDSTTELLFTRKDGDLKLIML